MSSQPVNAIFFRVPLKHSRTVCAVCCVCIGCWFFDACCGHKLVDFYFYPTRRQTTPFSSTRKIVFWEFVFSNIFHASVGVNVFHLVVVFRPITLHQIDSIHILTSALLSRVIHSNGPMFQCNQIPFIRFHYTSTSTIATTTAYGSFIALSFHSVGFHDSSRFWVECEKDVHSVNAQIFTI